MDIGKLIEEEPLDTTMVDAAPQNPCIILSDERRESGSEPLRAAKLPAWIDPSGRTTAEQRAHQWAQKFHKPNRDSPDDVALNSRALALHWISEFNRVVKSPNILNNALSALFLAESYWRDQLCLSWNSRCIQGPSNMTTYRNQDGRSRTISLKLDESQHLLTGTIDAEETVYTIQACLIIETDVGHGRGLVRLAMDNDTTLKATTWKAFTLFTYLKELKNHKECPREQSVHGVAHKYYTPQNNWLDLRKIDQRLEDGLKPAVIIIGAGQAGLTVAARLKMLDVRSLIVDRAARVGDNWRSRYHQLVLHDIVWFDQLPYMPFPESWPVFTPKDKLGDWLEAYAKFLELNIWTETTISEAAWDDAAGQWTVKLDKTEYDDATDTWTAVSGATRVFHPNHIIQATGASGEPQNDSGQATFKGIFEHEPDLIGANCAIEFN